MLRAHRKSRRNRFGGRLDGPAKGLRHPDGITGHGDGGVDQHGIGTELDRLGGMTRRADSCINDDGDGGLFDDDRDLGAGLEAAIAPDRRAEGHDGRRAGFLKPLGQHGVGIDVGKDGESLRGEDLGRLERLDRIGKKIAGIGMDLEFHPLGESGGDGETGQADGLLGGVGSAGVGEEEILLRIDEFENVGEGILATAQIGSTKGDRDDLGATRRKGLAHHLPGRKFPGTQEEPGGEFPSGDGQRLGGRHPPTLVALTPPRQEAEERSSGLNQGIEDPSATRASSRVAQTG